MLSIRGSVWIAERSITFTDDKSFGPTKQGLFQLLAVVMGIKELPAVYDDLHNTNGQSELRYKTIQIPTAGELAASHPCQNRARPKYYDAFCIERELMGVKFITVRPDRDVALIALISNFLKLSSEFVRSDDNRAKLREECH